MATCAVIGGETLAFTQVTRRSGSAGTNASLSAGHLLNRKVTMQRRLRLAALASGPCYGVFDIIAFGVDK